MLNQGFSNCCEVSKNVARAQNAKNLVGVIKPYIENIFKKVANAIDSFWLVKT